VKQSWTTGVQALRPCLHPSATRKVVVLLGSMRFNPGEDFTRVAEAVPLPHARTDHEFLRDLSRVEAVWF